MEAPSNTIAPEIKAQMVEVYKVNSDATFEALSQTINQHFSLLPKRQIEIILEDKRPAFSKIAYQHLGQNTSIRRTLQNEMAQAALLGEGQKKIMKRIAKVTGMAEYQAQRVAQTERTRVQSQARADSLHEAAEMGIVVTKTWSARMRNTRDSHAALNGKTVMENEKFQTIWGNELAYPGNPDAPAREVINCHCVLVPDVLMPGERLKNIGSYGRMETENTEMETSYVNHVGNLNPDMLKQKWSNIKPRVVLTDERVNHILEGHKEDFEKYGGCIGHVIESPTYILEDRKNESTALYIGEADDSSISVVVKIAFINDAEDVSSSVITMYRCGEKRIRRLVKSYPLLYKRD